MKRTKKVIGHCVDCDRDIHFGQPYRAPAEGPFGKGIAHRVCLLAIQTSPSHDTDRSQP